jgi:FHA domain
MTEPHGSVTGKRIILEIVREMREGLHPLLYSRVAPGLYCVYLHPEDFSRLEGLVPRVRAEAQRALAEELRRLNEPTRAPTLRWFVAQEEEPPPIEVPAQGWEIQIEADRDEEVAAGTFVILSRLTLPPVPQFEGGAATTKVFRTVVSGETRTKTEQVIQTPRLPQAPEREAPEREALPPRAAGEPAADMTSSVPAAGARPVAAVPEARVSGSPVSGDSVEFVPLPTFASGLVAVPERSPGDVPTGEIATERAGRGIARIAVHDARGPRLFVMDKPDIKIGRGGQFRLVDLQLDGSIRISRVHARIRRDDQGRFFIKDLSEWGTTVNGQRIARGIVKEGDDVREIDVEAELPARARIGLAESVFLDFVAAEHTTGALMLGARA